MLICMHSAGLLAGGVLWALGQLLYQILGQLQVSIMFKNNFFCEAYLERKIADENNWVFLRKPGDSQWSIS